MQENIRIEVNQDDLDRINQRYGEELIKKSTTIVLNYSEILANEAKNIINAEDKSDSSTLISSIKPSMQIYARNTIKGEVNAGAKHAGGKITPRFDPFKVAPSLLKWAKTRNIIFRKNGNWHYDDSKGNYRVIRNIQNIGLMEYQRPTTLFSKPFQEGIKQDYINDMSKIIMEV